LEILKAGGEMMKKTWQYRMDTRSVELAGSGFVENILNQYGYNGWELVNIIPVSTSPTNDQDQAESVPANTYSFVFKREKTKTAIV
jgi:hypothetical protein